MAVQDRGEESQKVRTTPSEDIGPRIGEDRFKLQAIEELEEVNINPKDASRVVKLGRNLDDEGKAKLIKFLQGNLDVFA